MDLDLSLAYSRIRLDQRLTRGKDPLPIEGAARKGA
jgi:hypothetical protein